MASTEAQKRASTNYNKKQDNIMIRPTKEEGQRIRAAAKAAGLSVQGYVLQAVRAYMEHEGACLPSEPSQRPTEAVSLSRDTTTAPPQAETHTGEPTSRGGYIRDAAGADGSVSKEVAPSPTQDPRLSGWIPPDDDIFPDDLGDWEPLPWDKKR